MSALCHPSRENMLTGTQYTAAYEAERREMYERFAEPQRAVDNPIAKYFRPAIEYKTDAVVPAVVEVVKKKPSARRPMKQVRRIVYAVSLPVGVGPLQGAEAAKP